MRRVRPKSKPTLASKASSGFPFVQRNGFAVVAFEVDHRLSGGFDLIP
jgi:hypothetical protein